MFCFKVRFYQKLIHYKPSHIHIFDARHFETTKIVRFFKGQNCIKYELWHIIGKLRWPLSVIKARGLEYLQDNVPKITRMFFDKFSIAEKRFVMWPLYCFIHSCYEVLHPRTWCTFPWVLTRLWKQYAWVPIFVSRSNGYWQYKYVKTLFPYNIQKNAMWYRLWVLRAEIINKPTVSYNV